YPWDGKNIYFMGFMGTGKSRVARAFARLLGWPYQDTDAIIVEKAGLSVEDIFALHGEAYFRELEDEVVSDISKKKHHVFALGGGAVVREHNWNLIENSGLTICLYAEKKVLVQRLHRKHHRPLLKNLTLEEIQRRVDELLSQRQPYYDRAQYHFQSLEEVRADQLAVKIFNQLMDEI
ncbi:shikimate kinase, partial [candidate division KSB1 bacterium]|nr:shikimate kinase [candidate division KSB1 bacterium]